MQNLKPVLKIPNDWGFFVYKKTENNLFSLNLGIRYKFEEKNWGIPTFCGIIKKQ